MKENLLGQPVEEHEEEVASIATKFSTSKVHETTRLISELEEGDERDPNVVAADALPSAEVLVGHEEIVQPVTDFDSTFQVEPNSIITVGRNLDHDPKIDSASSYIIIIFFIVAAVYYQCR